MSGLPSFADPSSSGYQPLNSRHESSLAVVPLDEQPFYPELVKRADLWLHTPLGQVVGDTPKDTLLNFYAVMADVGLLIDDVTATHRNDPGLFWDRQTKQEMEEAEALFDAAVSALDGSSFPLGVRSYLKDEAAIQLKQALDFIFYNSRQIITIPDASGMKALNENRSRQIQSWTLPGSAITLSSQITDNPNNSDFYFSASTVANASNIYGQVQNQFANLEAKKFTTNTFYEDFIHTPGHLFPPKWYLILPAKFRGLIETEILFGETLFQVVLAAIAISIFAVITAILFNQLIQTYQKRPEDPSRAWLMDSLAWKRAALVLPLVPIAKLTELFIDEYLNFTGLPLIVLTVLFEVVYFSFLVMLVFLFFEAFGRSTSETLVRMSGNQETWELSRTSNRIMPICRVLSGVVAIALIYRMLLQLGLSPSVVLALSTVPGLAIGLGASKLLGNLFAGLSLQTDRPLRVGEFCELGDDQGFITKIGLRSVEIETATGIITIPNAVAEDCVVNNLSRNKIKSNTAMMQGLDLKLDLEGPSPFSPDQISDLLLLSRNFADNRNDLSNPCLTVELRAGDQQILRCIGLIKVSNWREYIELTESLTLALNQLIIQVGKSHFVLSVSYDTTDSQLSQIPGILQNIVNNIPGFQLKACRLMDISEFSYDFICHTFSQGLTYTQFVDSIDLLNRKLLKAMADAEIVIPFPTAIELESQPEHFTKQSH
ncbi:mechanosensitive ion channel family protein [Synechococcus sp. AH-551-A21]|nr:mechanosensitive ion channel domain-containing protein [Synechococcus sp. AH-551-A21]MDB4677745.1 mechanosensitive ion channel family protein [Synechococcus sp. AH-551-A21]